MINWIDQYIDIEQGRFIAQGGGKKRLIEKSATEFYQLGDQGQDTSNMWYYS